MLTKTMSKKPAMTTSTHTPRDHKAQQAYEASKTMLGAVRHAMTYTLVFEHGPITGPDLDERCRQATQKNLSLHTYLDDLCALGWIRRVGQGNSKITGKSGTLWDVTGEIGRLYKTDSKLTPSLQRRPSVTDIAASMIGFMQSRGTRGATYHEWFVWYRDTLGAKLDSATAIEYRGTGSARWKELQIVGVFIPTNEHRSQRDAVADSALKMLVPNKPAQVFVLREGATVIDYIKGDKRKRGLKRSESPLTADAAMVLDAYQSLLKSWMSARTKEQQEKLLLKYMTRVVHALNTASVEVSTETIN